MGLHTFIRHYRLYPSNSKQQAIENLRQFEIRYRIIQAKLDVETPVSSTTAYRLA